MPKASFVTVDVFTKTRFAGNPLAIVNIPKGRYVSDQQMQAIAREFNLSETVFLHEGSQDANGTLEWKIRIFLTDAEVPFAGHPTIGTACYALGSLGNGSTTGRLICKSGPINLVYREGLAQASIPHAVHIHIEHGYTVDDLYDSQPALRQFPPPKSLDVVSPVKGMNFVCAELESLEALAQVRMTGVKPTAKLDSDWDIGFVASYFYVVTGQEGGSLDIRSRMIEARMEDPATGSAAAALSALLALKHKLQSASFRITQGVEMGRRSDIGMTVKLTDSLDAVERIELSGSSVQVMEGTLQYD